MTQIQVYWWAIRTFLGKLPGGLVALYKNEVRVHRNALAVAEQLRDGYAPETLARQVCLSEGSEAGSARYQELLSDVLEIQARFNITQ